ncbi:NAD(P)/FAD-dependent oxidoreductase [Baekduia sp.]|jgi:NADPH-dependent 2,4-dienoyl-CoA reductase/sulfur reductase-like enzyme|uniref:NAD(P)/FAD-dependent oxidoreductase n=1 Tax=Baekduia sp. TaxID=2600305 RepID=UPI002E07A35F|nr:FAD-dependent oxidoreductase [Baekduia sp.]
MSTCALLVVGGGPAGHSAATAYRAADGTGAVILLAGEGRAPYERPPLSKELLRGKLEPEALPLAEHPAYYDEREITVRHDIARSLHPEDRRVSLADGAGEITYDHCILATGAQPVRPPIPGADRDGVHLLRTVTDALALRAAAAPAKHVLVLGSGFIGCEAAASLRLRGCAVTLVSQEPAPQAQRLGDEVAARLARWLAEAGVETQYGCELTVIDPDLRAQVSDGSTVDADLILLAGGVAPDTTLAREAGLTLADGGEIAVDTAMRTSAPGVLACGDCCHAEHAIAGRPLHVEHWGDALAQGEIAGASAAGREAVWDTVPGFWSTIGTDTIKYAAWGDGYKTTHLVDHGGGAFTAWYADAQGRCVGVLTHDRDPDYETGQRLIAQGASAP